ncbi:hypothetical protein LCGC14_2936460, partial [marine sediment metagenome]
VDTDALVAGVVTNAQGADVASDVAAMIDGNNRVDVGSWLGTAVGANTAGIPKVDIQLIRNNGNAATSLTRIYGNNAINGTADSGTVNTMVDSSLTQPDGAWNGGILQFTTGNNDKFSFVVTDFDAASDTVTFTPDAPNAVANGDVYVIVSSLAMANIAAINNGAMAAANLELQYDGSTGLVGDTFPAPQSQVGAIAIGSGGLAVVAESATITTGTETLTYTSTEELDGATHDVAAAGGATDFYYQFDVGSSGVATELHWFGYAQSNNDSYAVKAYDWLSAGFKQIGTLAGGNGSTVSEHAFVPTTAMTGTGANVGKVRLQFTSADGTEIFTDRVICEFTQAAQGIANGSTITLGAATGRTNLVGRDWILALGGQDITN